MKKVRLILLLVIFPLLAFNQPVSLDYARKQYFTMNGDNCNSLRLVEKFEKNKPTGGLLKAYYGASAAAAPECIGNPAGKLSMFKKGKQLLDEAVKNEPDNYEIRFLRFATQDKAPRFLGYDDNIAEDKSFLIANIQKGNLSLNNSFVFKEILSFLANSDSLNQKEKLIVKEYLTNLNN